MMGLTPHLQAFAIELHHREQIVLVGNGDRRHAERGGAFHELRDAHHTVLQREFGVQAEVDESGSGRHGARVYTRTRALIVLAKGFNEMETEAALLPRPELPGFVLTGRRAQSGNDFALAQNRRVAGGKEAQLRILEALEFCQVREEP